MIEFLPWARQFARACTSNLPGHFDRDDLQSAGVLGYLHAASRYDVKRGASFRGYCAVRIRGAVLDEVRKWTWAPRSVYKKQRRITRVTNELTEQLEREPSRSELAHALGVEEGDLNSYEAQSLPRQVVSFDEVSEYVTGDENLSLTDRLPDPSAARPVDRILSVESRRIILECMRSLPITEGIVIDLHYLQGVPLRKVALILEVTPSRISQLHHQALTRLRHGWQRRQITAV